MGVSLSIKDVPEALARRLRARADANHRSLQRELMALIEAAVDSPAAPTSTSTPVRVEAREPETAFAPQGRSTGRPPIADDLLSELDAVVAGTRWGEGAMLSRSQRHDRRLARELDYDVRLVEVAEPSSDAAPPR